MRTEKNKKSLILKLEILLIMVGLILTSTAPLIGAFDDHKSQLNDVQVDVTRMNTQGVTFSISLGEIALDSLELEGRTFDKVSLSHCGYTSSYGKAALPVISLYIAVPQGAEVEMKYDFSEYSTEIAHDICPAQPPLPETGGYQDPPFTMSEEFYTTDVFYPQTHVEVSPIKIMRGCRFVMVSVFPVLYNPVQNVLKIVDDITVQLDFAGGTNEFIPNRLRSMYFQPLLDAYLLNSPILERATIHSPQTSLLSRDDRADLLIVVYDDFYEEILSLAEWRHLSGLETKVVKWSEIGTTAEDLRTYMTNAYNSWELPPSFLLIVGDADHVPVNYMYSHPYGGGYTGTDLWYCAIEGSDYFPEIHGGRISVEDENELNVVVDKTLEYSRNPYMDEDWFNNVLLAAKEESGRYFVWTSETIFNFLDPLGYNVIRQYQGGTPPGSTQGVIDAIDAGVIIANHRDHGASENSGYYYTGWCAPEFTTQHILNDIDNGHKYPVMFSLNCESGWFDGETDIYSGNYESIGEVGIRVAERGFIAVIAASRVSYSGYNDELCRGFYDAMFADFDPNYPDEQSTNPFDTEVHRISQILNYGKFWLYDKYVAPGGCPPYPWNPDEVTSRTEFEMFHVHGDPTVEIWTAFPQIMTVDHPERVPFMQSTVQVVVNDENEDPVEGALVCLSQEDGLYAKGITNEFGEAEIQINPTKNTQISVIVTAHNFLYYDGVMSVNGPPEIPDRPSGPDVGETGKLYLYSTSSVDLDGDRILYNFSWGDDTYSGWVGPFDSGETGTATHAWEEKGDYEIKVKAKDTRGEESDWSEPLAIRIPQSFNQFSTFFSLVRYMNVKNI
jgi:hypothetical protein